jgi:hypothetical protein
LELGCSIVRHPPALTRRLRVGERETAAALDVSFER